MTRLEPAFRDRQAVRERESAPVRERSASTAASRAIVMQRTLLVDWRKSCTRTERIRLDLFDKGSTRDEQERLVSVGATQSARAEREQARTRLDEY